MIDAQGNTKAEMPINECIRDIPRTNSDVVCEISLKLDSLKKAIEANTEAVSALHKELWRKQASAMKDHVDTLIDRIQDLIDSDT